MRRTISILVVLSLLALAGCAAATRGSSEGELGPNKMRKSPCANLVSGYRHA